MSEKYASLDILYTEIRAQLIRQLDSIDVLNSRNGTLIMLDSVLFSGGLYFLGRSGDVAPMWQSWLLTGLIAISAILLIISFGLALGAAWIQDWAGIINPRGAYNDLLLGAPEISKLNLVQRWIEDYESNDRNIQHKARCMRAAFLSLLYAVSVACLCGFIYFLS